MYRLTALLIFAIGGDAASLAPFPLTIPIGFEENRGQSPKEFRFLVSHANVGLACDAIYQKSTLFRLQLPPSSIRFVNANSNCQGSLAEPDGSSSRYYRGENQSKSIDNVFRHRKARFASVWPGVDLEYSAKSNAMVATFQMRVASNLSAVRLQARFISAFEDSGISSDLGIWRLSAEQGRSLKVRVIVDTNGIAGFAADGADPLQPLTFRMEIPVAMPVDRNSRSTVDRQGNWYVTSSAVGYSQFDPDAAPCVNGSIATNPCPDVYVASFSPKGNLRYLVYLMGSRYDAVFGITTDPGGNVFVTGSTYSKDFVTTSNALQANYAGPEEMITLQRFYALGDAFVVKLHGPSGGLIYSTYLGTEATDAGLDIFADYSGQASLVVTSNGTSLPLRGDPIVENTPGFTRLISLNDAGSEIRYALGVPVTHARMADDGSTYMIVNNVPDGPPAYELIALTPDGTLRYRRPLDSTLVQGPAGTALRPDGGLWLAFYHRNEQQVLIGWTLYQVDAGGGEPRLVTDQIPSGYVMESDGNGGLWIGVHSYIATAPPPTIGLTATSDAPLKSACNACGGLLHVDAAGAVKFASFLPIDPFFLQAASGSIFLQTNYSPTTGLTSYVLNESDISGPVLAAVVDTIGPSASFYPGNVISLIGARLGPDNEVRFPVDNLGRAATLVGGLRVLVDDQESVILSASSEKLVILLPFQLPSQGNGSLVVEQDGEAVASIPFQYGGQGFGILAGPNAPFRLGFENEDGTMNSESNPAPVGSTVKFYIVSVGPTNPTQIEREIKHSILPKPLRNIDVRFSFNAPPQELISLHQAEQFVTGIFEVRVRVGTNVPDDRVPVMIGYGGFPHPQWQLPQLYVRR